MEVFDAANMALVNSATTFLHYCRVMLNCMLLKHCYSVFMFNSQLTN